MMLIINDKLEKIDEKEAVAYLTYSAGAPFDGKDESCSSTRFVLHVRCAGSYERSSGSRTRRLNAPVLKPS